ncbi:MAG TPA: hypothetical protein VKA43_08755, partial [Gammaproteobacteria bacterium]|nr:hypothetical protein [Gammaproteobacteria bacterium]
SRGVFGMSGLDIASAAAGGAQGSVLTSRTSSIDLPRGTQMLLVSRAAGNAAGNVQGATRGASGSASGAAGAAGNVQGATRGASGSASATGNAAGSASTNQE